MQKQLKKVAGNSLPACMLNWKEDIGKGALAAIEVYESLDAVLHGDGGLEQSLYGLTRAELLAVDPLTLSRYLDDLRDLQEQADYAVEAMEAVIAAVEENDESDED
jgi:hypothetical protein